MNTKYIKQIRQRFCNHIVNYTIDCKRDSHGNVNAKCLKCGKNLHADCYLNMNAKLVREGEPK